MDLHTFVVADSCRQPQTYVKPEAAITVFELLMMSGVSLETCWAIKKHWNNKFYYTVASCWLFLYDLHKNDNLHVVTLRQIMLHVVTLRQIHTNRIYKCECFLLAQFSSWNSNSCVLIGAINKGSVKVHREVRNDDW